MKNFLVDMEFCTVEFYQRLLSPDGSNIIKGNLIYSFRGGVTFSYVENVRYLIYIIPDNGFEISDIPPIQWGASWNPQSIFFNLIDGEWRSDYSNTLNFSGAPDPITVSPIFSGSPVSVSTPYNRLYYLDADKLKDFSEKPLATFSPSGSGGVTVTYAEFITKLHQIPYKIPVDFLGDSTPIFIGGYNVEIETPTIKNDLVTIPLAEFNSINFEGNVLDLIATEYELYLPYINSPIVLNSFDVANESLNVSVTVDMYSGNSTVNVFSSELAPISSTQLNLSRELQTSIGEYSSKNSVYGSLGEGFFENGFDVPYLKKKVQVLEKGRDKNLVKVKGLLGSSIGFIKVDYCEINFHKSLLELSGLLDVLESGVIIK